MTSAENRQELEQCIGGLLDEADNWHSNVRYGWCEWEGPGFTKRCTLNGTATITIEINGGARVTPGPPPKEPPPARTGEGA